MDTLQYWQAIAEVMIKIPAPSKPSKPAIPPPSKPIFRSKNWKATHLANHYLMAVYGDEIPPTEPTIPPKPDPLRPHEFPLKRIRFSGRETDKTNFTKLQELWNGIEKPLEIKTAGHRTHNLTTKLK